MIHSSPTPIRTARGIETAVLHFLGGKLIAVIGERVLLPGLYWPEPCWPPRRATAYDNRIEDIDDDCY